VETAIKFNNISKEWQTSTLHKEDPYLKIGLTVMLNASPETCFLTRLSETPSLLREEYP